MNRSPVAARPLADVMDQQASVLGDDGLQHHVQQAWADELNRRARRPRVVGVAGAAVAVMTAVTAWWAVPREQPLVYFVGTETTAGAVGRFVGATGAPVPLRFSDQSTVRVEPGARARVQATSARGAVVGVEHGTVNVHVQHRSKDTAWRVQAGPYVVNVVGTQFALDWQSDRQVLTVSLFQGGVQVREPSGSLHELTQRKILHANATDGTVEVVSMDAPPEPLWQGRQRPSAPKPDQAVATALETPDHGGQAAVEPPKVPDPSPPRTQRSPRIAPSKPQVGPRPWLQAVRSGDYAAVLADVNARGLDQAMAHSSASEVLELADALRLAGAPQLAARGYRAVRKRSGGDAAAASAAFMLGCLAQDAEHQPKEARAWFETYQREQPNGPLAQEAGFRLLEATVQLGDDQATRRVAAQFLERYPDAPQAARARSLLGP